MNNRSRKKYATRRKIEHGKRKDLHKILDLVLDINGLEGRWREVSGNLPTVFFYFHGHVGSVDVSVHTSGWGDELHPDWRGEARNVGDADQLAVRLETLRDELLTRTGGTEDGLL